LISILKKSIDNTAYDYFSESEIKVNTKWSLVVIAFMEGQKLIQETVVALEEYELVLEGWIRNDC
jgi:hypothetical protein